MVWWIRGEASCQMLHDNVIWLVDFMDGMEQIALSRLWR
jgi:hypothetical protein